MLNREVPATDRSGSDAEVDPAGSLPRPMGADARRDGFADVPDPRAGLGGTGGRCGYDGHRADRDQGRRNQRPPTATTAPKPLQATQDDPSARSLSESPQPVRDRDSNLDDYRQDHRPPVEALIDERRQIIVKLPLEEVDLVHAVAG